MRIMRVCRTFDLTPNMSGVVWINSVSPFLLPCARSRPTPSPGKGTSSVILFKNYGLNERVPLPVTDALECDRKGATSEYSPT